MIKLRRLPGGRVVARIAGLRESLRHVTGIRGALEIGKVARNAGIRSQIVVVVDMAIRTSARWHRVHAGQREVDGGVIESRRRPCCGGVTGIASRGEIRRHMAGICRSLEIFQVTAHAGRRVQSVIIVDVTIGALPRRYRVHAREREPGGAVVEGRVRPCRGVMALLAGLRKTRSDVVGIRCSLEVRQMAAHACRSADRVVVVDVTIAALPGRHGVHSGERESGRIVVECGIRPSAGSVALVAGLREIRSDVVGIRRALEIFQVTSCASGATQREVAVDVAIGALARRHSVQSGQGEAGCGVIKFRIAPLHRIVAVFAGGGEAAMRHRSSRAREIFLVAAEAR